MHKAKVKSKKLKVKSSSLRAVFTFYFLLFTFNFSSAAPTTQSTPDDLSQRIAQCIETLANPDPLLRAGAREALLASGRRDDLDTIRKVVQEVGPLSPNQAAALREIIEHIFLSGQSYEKVPSMGFLGVQLRPISVSWSPAGGVPGSLNGVEIMSRYPGFCGYASLQDGDVILEVGPHGQPRLPAGLDMPGFVPLIHPGATIDMQLVRQGRLITVPIVLGARPAGLDDPAETEESRAEKMHRIISDRQTAADRYWETNFAPLTVRKPS